jgi:hypothetical protein
VWNYCYSNAHSINHSDDQEFAMCFFLSMIQFAELESHTDWAAYNRQLGSSWSGVQMKYELLGNTWNVETAKHILTEMKLFYNPPFNKDSDCKCTICS